MTSTTLDKFFNFGKIISSALASCASARWVFDRLFVRGIVLVNSKRPYLTSVATVSLFTMVIGFSFVACSPILTADELGNAKKPTVSNAASNLPNLYTPSGRPKAFVDSQTRKNLESIPIAERPNRPLHFYGNAVRRRTNASESRPFGGKGPIRR